MLSVAVFHNDWFVFNGSLLDFKLLPDFLYIPCPVSLDLLIPFAVRAVLWTALIIVVAGMSVLIYRYHKKLLEQKEQIDQYDDKLAALEEKNQSLEYDNHLKNDFLSNISQLISDPLNRLLNYSELLSEQTLPASEESKYKKSLSQQVRILNNILKDISDLHQIKNDEIRLEYQDFDLNEMMDDIYELGMREKEKQKREQVDIKIEKYREEGPFYIHSDRNRLRQFFLSLLQNALLFTHEGEIRIGYRQDGEDHIILYVRDTGKIISRKQVEKMLGGDAPVGIETGRVNGEAGIKLSIASGITEKMDGDLDVTSSEGYGAEFFCRLPLLQPSSQFNFERESTSFDYGEYDWSGKTIMVVEDSQMAYKLIKKLFEDTRAEFVLEMDGIKALERCKNDESIDLVLMDIQLPMMDGYESTRKIKNIKPNLPIIAQTANALSDDREKAINAGCDDYIAKPIDRLELATKINTFLNDSYFIS